MCIAYGRGVVFIKSSGSVHFALTFSGRLAECGNALSLTLQLTL